MEAVLFLGSSSIRLWTTLAQDFPILPVINRGFGGSQIADSVRYAERIVFPYKPKMIVFYAGGNDLNAGKSPNEVLKDFQDFVGKVHATLPMTRIVYLSINPSVARWSQEENVLEANRLIRRFIRDTASKSLKLSFLDSHSRLLSTVGKPRPEILRTDGLHLNAKGYTEWTAILKPQIMALWKAETMRSEKRQEKASNWKPKRLLITFWSPPPATEETLAAVAAEGYNLTWTPEAGLDVAQKHGLKAMLQDDLLTPATLDNPERRAKLEALVDRVKKHPALEAYYLTDEPSASAFVGLGKLTAFLRERDPVHLAYINLFPTYANNEQLGTKGDTVTAYREHLRQYLQSVKPALLSYDHYHFFQTGDGEQYFLNLGMIRQAALEAGIPFLNIIQASTIEKSWRLVNADELRWLVYTTLAYGGRGISYFLYWGPTSYGGLYQDGKKTLLADAVPVLNKEIAALSPVLMKLDTLAVYHSTPLPIGAEACPESSPVRLVGAGEFVLGVFGRSGKASVYMVVNRNYKQEAAAHLSVPQGTHKIEEYNCAVQRWNLSPSPVVDHTFSVLLKPGDGRLFRLAR